MYEMVELLYPVSVIYPIPYMISALIVRLAFEFKAQFKDHNIQIKMSPGFAPMADEQT